MVRSRTASFSFEGQRLVFDEYGSGDRVVLLLPPLLFSRRIHQPLAETLAERGHRVLCLDLLGHGDSDRPPEMTSYSMQTFGRQGVALLDRLDVKRAVVGGPSLGANVTLEVAAGAPERVRGMLVQMPVLDNALLGCAIAFTPLLMSLTFGAPVTRLIGRGASLVPRGYSHLGDSLLDWMSQDPKPSASVLQGLFFGRVAPPAAERRKMRQPTLVIGHRRDPVHPFSDSDMLIHELPNARLIEANSIMELWTSPERLTGKIVPFIEQCFRARKASSPRRPVASRSGSGQGARRRSSKPLHFSAVSSRREQKEALRREREQREKEAQAAAARKRLVGYGGGGLLVIAVAVVLIVTLSGSGGSDGNVDPNVLPDGGSVPEQEEFDLATAAKAAGCELRDVKASGNFDHTTDPNERVKYNSNPPTSGRHFAVPVDDGAYTTAPTDEQLVHNLEHGRVIVWYKPSLPKDMRADLKAFFDEDTYQMVLAPRPNMPYQVAASAWNGTPEPAGLGRLITCDTVQPEIWDALRAFRDEHRSNGPEPVP